MQYKYFYTKRTLPRRRPTISRWAGCHMANTDKWYYPGGVRLVSV